MNGDKLLPLNGYKSIRGPVVTVIMDGVGIGKGGESDGVAMAYKPVLDGLKDTSLYTSLKAHGKAVGLPSDDDMGNSEVGHNALGAGRVFAQGAKLVNAAIASGSIFQGAAWKEIEERCKAGAALHLIGLVSDGNVHSHIDHLYALLEHASRCSIGTIRIHGLIDGRDVGDKSALDYFLPLEKRCSSFQESGFDYRIASGGGRMITTMDRYQADWSVVERGWKAHVLGQGTPVPSASAAIRNYYEEDPANTDQYMDSFVVVDDAGPVGKIENGDAVIFFNFRGDRAIEISQAFEETDFKGFDRQFFPDVFYAGMMQYDGDAFIPEHYLVQPPAIDHTLGEYLCAAGVPSYAISETQKFGHVTYFWNGNKSGYIDETLEHYVEIPSDRVTFDKRPWMKAAEITDAVVAAILSGSYRFIRLNYPNGDMVGHTGAVPAVRIAVETVDLCLGRVLAAVKKAGGIVLVTADHGNADCMWTEKNNVRSPMVAHTLNPVPFIVKDFDGANRFVLTEIEDRGLVNVAATICILLGYEPPEDYAPSLVAIKN